jgi:hypothetical protein
MAKREWKNSEAIATVCLWSDGTWCEWEDLEDYLSWMSDDFQVLNFFDESQYNDWLMEH